MVTTNKQTNKQNQGLAVLGHVESLIFHEMTQDHRDEFVNKDHGYT